MKRLIPTAILAVVILLAACNGNKQKTFHPSGPDTAIVLSLIDTGGSTPAFKMDKLYRIITDSVKFVQKDSSTLKKELSRDTVYYYQQYGQVFSPDHKSILRTASGKDSMNWGWNLFPNFRVIIDGGSIQVAVNKYLKK